MENANGKMTVKEFLTEHLDDLTERQQKVVKLHFGLEDGHVRTLEEVAEELGVSASRIRQIESMAVRRVIQPNRRKPHVLLREFLHED